MKSDERVDPAAQAIVRRAEERFQAHWMEIASWTDRFFARLLVGLLVLPLSPCASDSTDSAGSPGPTLATRRGA